MRSERLEVRNLMAAHPFHNEAIPEDVTEDGQVTALDALTVINQINNQRGDQVGARGRGRMTDVNNDGRDSAVDVLMIINRLNRNEGPGQANDGLNEEGPRNDNVENGRPRDERGEDANENERGERQQQSDLVIQWNNLFNELLVADEEQQNPGYASRAMAMLNLAIYDAVTITDGDVADTFYEYDLSGLTGDPIRTDAAVSQAAYTVLSSLYSGQQDMIDQFRDRVFRRIEPGPGTADGVELGNEIGSTILAERANDGHDTVGDYTYSDEPGSFQPDPLNPDVPVWGPAWSEVDPFVVSSAEDYAPQTTPPLDSAEYAASYNEVKELGSVDSETRTADQTEAGIFWAYDRVGLGTPMSLFSDAIEAIATQQGNSLQENAALFAQASVAMADAGVVAWHTKFSEQFWRPVTAIQSGDLDGNDLTEGDPEWTALGAPDGGDDIIGFTPQFPTYISGHATFGGAVFGAIREFYGTDDISFELESKELEILMDNPELQAAYGLDLDDATRSFGSLTEAMAENGRSRVYLGIHFDFDDTVGQDVGQAVASTVASEFVVAANDNGEPGRDDGPGRDEGPSKRPGDGPLVGNPPNLGGGNPPPPANPEPLPPPPGAPLPPPADVVGGGQERPGRPPRITEEMGMPEMVDEADLDLIAREQAGRREEGRPERNRDRPDRGNAAANDDDELELLTTGDLV
ncbi:MAG: dockerin type I domain-containing protein [Planctomycetota bacterium]